MGGTRGRKIPAGQGRAADRPAVRESAGRRSPARGVFAAALVAWCLVACAGAARQPREVAARSDAAAEGDPAAEGDGGTENGDDAGEATGEGTEVADESGGGEADGPCGEGMALVEAADRRFCIDRYEASLVEVLPDGTERAYPHFATVDGKVVRAVSRPQVFPQGFISEVQAGDACVASNKRLCTHDEWKTACMGPSRTTFPYGEARRSGTCHDTGKSAVGAVFGAKAIAASPPPLVSHPSGRPAASSGASGASGAGKGASHANAGAATASKPTKGKPAHGHGGRAASTTKARPPRKGSGGASGTGSGVAGKGNRSGPTTTTTTKRTRPGDKPAPAARRAGRASARPASVDPSVWTRLNDPALGQVEGALAKTGDHGDCVNDYGVFDMVGNLHEWVATDAALPHGTFAGGYYLDTSINGAGCNYRTVAHAHDYHDYSTGFRCCAEAPAAGAEGEAAGSTRHDGVPGRIQTAGRGGPRLATTGR